MKKQEEHHKESWRWAVTNNVDAQRVIEAVLPYLLGRRAKAARACLDVIEAGRSARESGVAHRADRLARMREMESRGMTVTAIAREVGISRQLASKILNT